jgi:leucyl-tRNA synthetase
MNSDSKLISDILCANDLNGEALLAALEINGELIKEIDSGRASLRIAEKMLLTILKKNPSALDFSLDDGADYPFTITIWRNSLKNTDQRIEDFIAYMRIQQVKSGLSVDEFMAGTRNNNEYRMMVHEFFHELYEKNIIGKDAARIYQTPFWKSFKTGVPFKRSNFGSK